MKNILVLGIDCSTCREGWEMDEEVGCLDVNECLTTDSQVCRVNEFCVNTEGSYSCIRKFQTYAVNHR